MTQQKVCGKHSQFRFSAIYISVCVALAVLSSPVCLSQTFDTTLRKAGSYDDVSIDINPPATGEVHGINLHGSDNKREAEHIHIMGNLNVRIKTEGESNPPAIGILALEGVTSAAHLIVDKSLDLDIEATGHVFGVMHSVAWGKGVFDNGSPHGGSIAINGAVDIDVTGAFRAGGVVSGSWFGNTYGVEHAFGDITLGDDGATNRISVGGGLGTAGNGTVQDDKMIGVLAYGFNAKERTSVVIRGSTDIVVENDKTEGIKDWDRLTAGVYAARDSRIVLGQDDKDARLNIVVSAKKNHYVFGIVSGLYDASKGSDLKSAVDISGKTTYIDLTGNYAYGVGAFGGSTVTIDSDLVIDASKEDRKVYGLWAEHFPYNTNTNALKLNAGGHIEVKGGYITRLADDAILSSAAKVAINSIGSTNISKKPSVTVDGTGCVSQIHGGIQAEAGGTVNVKIDGQDSFIKGHVDQRLIVTNGKWGVKSHMGKIDLTLANGAKWYNLDLRLDDFVGNLPIDYSDGISALNSLTVSGGALIDMSSMPVEDWQRSHYQKIYLKSLSGVDSDIQGKFLMDMNLATETDDTQTDEWLRLNTDQIRVDGVATGNYEVALNFITGLEGIAQDKMYSENWLIHQDAIESDMTVTGPGGQNNISGNGMVSAWAIKFVADGTSDQLGDEQFRESLTNHGQGKGDWHLIRTKETTPEIDQNLELGISATQALSFASEIEDLRTRLGEVRYGAQDGAWARGTWMKDHAKGAGGAGFEQKTTGIHIGLDRLVGADETKAWLVGGALRYAKSDQEGYAANNEGELEQYSAKLYATWMQDNGNYADFVIQAGYYDQELTGIANDGVTGYSAQYETWGFGASVEIGRMIAFGNAEDADDRPWYGHWFIEPQAQLAYFHANGKDYRTTTGMAIEQENADFLTGRLGLVLGKKVTYGTLDELDKRYFQFAVMGGAKYEFLGDQSLRFTGTDGISQKFEALDMGGVRWYYGVMADWQATNDLRFYAQLSREESDDYTREISAQIGFKYQF